MNENNISIMYDYYCLVFIMNCDYDIGVIV